MFYRNKKYIFGLIVIILGLSFLILTILHSTPLAHAGDTDLDNNMESVNQFIKRILSPKDIERGKKTGNEPEYRCGTPIITNARNNKDLLWPENQSILFRPTELKDSDYYGNVKILFYDSIIPGITDSPHFRLHYTEDNKNGDAVSGSNGDPNIIPDYILRVSESLEEAYHNILQMGYMTPEMDSNIGGGNNLIDIYILELEGCCYAYTNIDENGYIYICLDNNLNESTGKLETTIAHELFHVIQFKYEEWFDLDRDSYMSNIWWEESTAVWMEDELYDNINDYVNYLPSRFYKLFLPLDYNSYQLTSFEYGGVIFAKLLSEEIFDSDIIREIFERCNKINPKLAKQAISDVLAQKGKTWKDVMELFYEKNLKRDYKDAYELLHNYQSLIREYPTPGFLETITLNHGYLSGKINITHLSAHYYKLLAGTETNDIFICVYPSDFTKRLIPLLFVETERNPQPSKDMKRIYPDANLTDYDFKITGFGASGQYKQAYLVIINPDPRSDNYFYIWTAGDNPLSCEPLNYSSTSESSSGCFISNSY